MPRFLYKLSATRTEMLADGGTAAERETVDQHFARLEDLAATGIVLLAGRTQNRDASSFGIVILEAEDESAARTIMEEDPAVVDGVMTVELFPYRIAVVSEGLEPG